MIQKEANDNSLPDLTTELAKERTHTAYENNLMSWIRTSLSLIGFGIGIFEVSQQSNGNTIFRSSKLVGLLLVLLGVAAILMAINENKKNLELLSNPALKYQRNSSLAVKISYILLGIGALGIINIIY